MHPRILTPSSDRTAHRTIGLHSGLVSEPSPSDQDFAGLQATPQRSGKVFVIGTGVFLAVLLILILTVGRSAQDNLGLNDGLGFDVPTSPVSVPLTLDGVEVGMATWDAEGICAEVTDRTGTTFRTCATPDPLRPIWALDAPDEADPGYVLVATPPEAASVAGITTAGEGLNALVQARELRAAWALVPLPEGAVLSELVIYNTESSDLGNALCGVEDAPTNGSDRLDGGCLIPEQD